MSQETVWTYEYIKITWKSKTNKDPKTPFKAPQKWWESDKCKKMLALDIGDHSHHWYWYHEFIMQYMRSRDFPVDKMNFIQVYEYNSKDFSLVPLNIVTFKKYVHQTLIDADDDNFGLWIRISVLFKLIMSNPEFKTRKNDALEQLAQKFGVGPGTVKNFLEGYISWDKITYLPQVYKFVEITVSTEPEILKSPTKCTPKKEKQQSEILKLLKSHKNEKDIINGFNHESIMNMCQLLGLEVSGDNFDRAHRLDNWRILQEIKQ